MKRVTFPLFILFLVPLWSGAAQPQERVREMVHRRMQMHDQLPGQLDLSEDQQSKMEKLRLDFQKKKIENRARIQAARVDLKGLFLADKLDRSTIEKQLKTISDLQYQAKLNHLDHMFAVSAILTAEQQKIWKKHMGAMGMQGMKRMEKRMEMMHRGRGMGPGRMGEEQEDDD